MKLDGYTFDTGATLMLMPEVYAETFAALGERMQDYLDLRRIDPTYHLYFPDNSSMLLTSDMHAMQEQLEAIQPGSFERMLRYLAAGSRIYDLSLDNLVGRDFRTLFDFINPRMLMLFLRLKGHLRHTDYAARFFKDPRLLMAFTFQDMYMGLSPYNSPATYSLMQSKELAGGVWYPLGGMYRVGEALAAIAGKAGRAVPVRCPRGADPDRRRPCHRRPAGGWPRASSGYRSLRTQTWAMSTAVCSPIRRSPIVSTAWSTAVRPSCSTGAWISSIPRSDRTTCS